MSSSYQKRSNFDINGIFTVCVSISHKDLYFGSMYTVLDNVPTKGYLLIGNSGLLLRYAMKRFNLMDNLEIV